MARSLEGKTFFVNYNNGVTSITPERVVRNQGLVATTHDRIASGMNQMDAEVRAQYMDALKDALAHIPTTPVFTFVDDERKSKSPWFTGTTHTENALVEWVKENGGHIEGNAGYVPFSNAAELGVHGPDAMRNELRYVTTEAQFEEIFGIGPRDVEVWHVHKRAAKNNDSFTV